MVLMSQFCLSVYPSLSACIVTKQNNCLVNISAPYETGISLVFHSNRGCWELSTSTQIIRQNECDPRPSKNADFDRFLLTISQLYNIAKKFNFDE